MGPPGATFAHFGGTFGYLGQAVARFYAFLSGFREHLCIFAENSWKTTKIQQIAPKITNIARKHSKSA